MLQTLLALPSGPLALQEIEDVAPHEEVEILGSLCNVGVHIHWACTPLYSCRITWTASEMVGASPPIPETLIGVIGTLFPCVCTTSGDMNEMSANVSGPTVMRVTSWTSVPRKELKTPTTLTEAEEEVAEQNMNSVLWAEMN